MMKNVTRLLPHVYLLLASAGVLVSGCAESKSEPSQALDGQADSSLESDAPGPFQPGALDPNQIVFAFKSSGGMAWLPEDVLHFIHHGNATYVYGDGTVWSQVGPWGTQTGYYRQWKKGALSAETWQAVLDAASLVRRSDAGYYEVCPALDAGTEHLVVNLPGLEFSARAFCAFETDLDCEPQLPPEKMPREELVDLVASVRGLAKLATEVVHTEDTILAWYELELQSVQNFCGTAAVEEWPFEDVPLSLGQGLEIQALMLSGQKADDVRAFIQERRDLLDDTNLRACVTYQQSTLVVLYDDALPIGTTYPFFDGDLEGMTL